MRTATAHGAGVATPEELVPVFTYICPSCGAPAYSSANAATVGLCPQCDEPLTTGDQEPAAPAPALPPPTPIAAARL
jgi:predicted amidophosphoribosyltransferase